MVYGLCGRVLVSFDWKLFKLTALCSPLVFHREIVSEMGELGVLGPTIKGMHNISVPYWSAVDIRVKLENDYQIAKAVYIEYEYMYEYIHWTFRREARHCVYLYTIFSVSERLGSQEMQLHTNSISASALSLRRYNVHLGTQSAQTIFPKF